MNQKASYRLLLCLTAALLCAPVVFTTYVPLVDFPNHLARAHILHFYEQVAAYQASYAPAPAPLPNLAVDVIVTQLLRFFTLLTAARIFLALTILLFVAGCHRLGRAIHGSPTWLALPCCFLVYNSSFLYGFVNYVFGVGLFCVTLSYWLEWRRELNASRFLLVTLLVVCSYLAHLSAYSFVGAAFVVVAAWDYRAGKESLAKTALKLAPLVLPAALLAINMRRGGQAGGIGWNSPAGKAVGLLSPVLTYNYVLDACVLAAFAAAALAAFVLARRGGGLRVAWPTFAAGVVLLLLYFLSPRAALGGSAVDVRFIVPCLLLCLLSLKLSLPARAGKFLLLAVLCVSCVRIAAVWVTWAGLSRRIASEVSRFDALPEGTRVYPMVVMPPDMQGEKIDRSFRHLANYTTTARHAFVPILFTIEGQQPIGFRRRPRFVEAPSYSPEEWRELSPRWLDYLNDYDYLWAYGMDDSLRALAGTRCTKVYEEDGFSLWRVNR
ncbi:MAG TPA: hypothetical protein VM914_03425 [Pyrinomonadaceae bacterium]|jgi:hypothetical protein|nr:hypothetical protein [Pyrinomonadaceae bacterium]